MTDKTYRCPECGGQMEMVSWGLDVAVIECELCEHEMTMRDHLKEMSLTKFLQA